jgi:aminoglycoside phosphotransferase (APT) family kinase protein
VSDLRPVSEVDPDLMRAIARLMPSGESTAPLLEEVELVGALVMLSREITEHTRQVMAGEQVDWSHLATGLSKAARVCHLQAENMERRFRRTLEHGRRGSAKGLRRLSSTAALTEDTAHHVLEDACKRAGIDPTGASLIRLGSNAVYRLAEPVIVRISRDGDSVENVTRQVLVARWLEQVDYPAMRALDVEQPVDLDGHVATFWVSVSEREEYAPVRQVAELIRRLHDLDDPTDFMLPLTQPFAELESRLAGLTNLDESDADFLRDRIAELRRTYETLDFPLPPGVIHGDANVGNVILSRDGEPVLIDLDGFAMGPREWDLVQTALFYERFGWHTEEEYRTFVDVYGFDIMTWEGYPVLAEYREISMTLWLCGKAGDDEAAAAEVRKRVEAIRNGGDRRDWAPF